MDLDGFGDLPGSTLKVSLHSEDAVSAVKYIDSTWYGGLSRKARWMDLVGDFAGDEPFVIDGDSLLQHILDDEMLAIGGEDLSMQLLHAKYAVERLLAEFLRRTRNFDIVFWHAHRFTSLIAGGDPFAYSSRCLARQVLIHHLQAHVDNLEVHQFKSVVDLEWIGYLRRRRPMYVMLNDGGVLSSDRSSSDANVILSQRVAILELMMQGLSCTLLFGVEFRDSKILSFVLDQRLDRKFRSRLNPRFGKAVNAAINVLNRTDLAIRGQFSSAPFTGFKLEIRKAADKDSPMIEVVKEVLSSTGENAALDHLLLYLFVAHVHLLPELAVGARARAYRQLHPDLESHLRSMFLPTIFFALERNYSGRELDIDGRIFVELLAFVSERSPSKLSDVIGDTLASTVDEIWQDCGSPCIDFQALSTQYPLPSRNVSPSEPLDFDVSVMPFESALFQEAISSVQAVVLNQDEESEPQAEGLHIPFSDTRHWHNESTILPKHLGGEDRVALTNWQRERKLRSEQRFVAKMQWQAESLTGALGRPLQRITIVPHASTPTKTSKPSTSQVPKPPKKGKKEHVSKADLIRQQHAAKKRIESDNSNETWWREQLAALSSLSVSAQTAQLDRLSNNRRSDEGWLAVETRLYRIHLLFLGWIERSSTQTEDLEQTGKARDEFTVRILRVAKETFENGNLFPSALAVLDTALRAIGLSCFYDTLSASSPNPLTEDRKLSFKFVKLLRSKTKSPAHKYMPIVEHPIEWQLRLFGEYMDRSMDSTDDPRVSFKPDAWQREVLDCLDQEGHSVLVVAPTSAGKTFISYYAMEQVLRTSDNDILVYIAPTKALVSQIAAEVYARFQKTFTSSGKSMWAIHTRDYRVNNPQNCQILVTVPEMFAIMLLSPPLAKVWTPRIKRIILDEIHTIGQQEGGAVWEQIILLAPCPIIGLSATIGEPEKFNTWLRSVQEAHGFRHTFINWPYRYSHLRKFEYVLRNTADTSFGGLEKHVASDCMRFLHPVSLLSFGPRNLPPDFSLEAADCLSLFYAFSKARDTLQIDIEALSPVVHLPSSSLLTQKDVLLYESVLKDQLKTIISLSDAQDDSSPLNQIVGFVQDPVRANIPAEVRARPAAAHAILSHLLGLIADLYKSGDLPAILFHFDRTGCEKAAKTLLNSLEEAETAWREASPEWARIMQQWQTWKAQAKAREAQAEKMRKNRNADEEDVLSTEDPAWQQSFDPNDPSAQFSFLSPKCSKALIEEAIDDMRWTSTPSWALRALRRGIGLHHSGMNKHYRTTVESLYRLGHLRVVIATGTLALGINAPTKTSVFCSDSPFLTALMYRQCAGRAGRRGYDLLGKVVFYGLPADRVQRLVLSKLPALGGNFPLTTTMVLRLFNLLHGSGHAPYAVEAVNSLLHLPQVGFTSETGRSELMHHIRFSIDYLRRSSLLDRLGNPINLFGLTNHLYYTEPSNFALAALVQSRVIHRLCRRDGLEDAKRGVLHLLCHLFGRRNVPRAYTSAENAKDLLAKSASKVILTPLSKAAVRVLREKDDTTLKIFNGYAVAFARQSAAANQLAADVALPLSGVVYAGSSSTNAFIEHLRATSIQVTARSSFVANSGHDDAFRSIADLTQNARSGIHLKEHGIPSFHHFISENPHALNAYILDFYNHGQTDPLVIANGIRRGEIWYLLQDFMLTLKTFRASLAHMLMAATESDTQDPDVEVQAVDPAEFDVMDAEAEGPTVDSLIRPRGVSDDDWKVYEVVHALTEDFDAKFRKMWA